MTMISILITVIIFLVAGSIFALPAFIPAFRRRARQSRLFRNLLTVILSFIAFAFLFVGLTYTGAVVSKTFMFFMYCGDFDCVGSPYPFEDDERRDALFTREIWLQSIVPPFLVSNETCFTGDADVCEVYQSSQSRRTERSLSNYLTGMFFLLIPAVTCAWMVRYITRSNRKQKH